MVRSPSETGVGGAGIAQVTGAGGVKTVPAPREVLWNWQKNTDAFLVILLGKIQIAEQFMNSVEPKGPTNPIPNGQRPQTVHFTVNNVPVPARIQHNITFSDSSLDRRPEDAVAIKAYNGASAHWCSFTATPPYEWQWNTGPNNYVEEVCRQVEEEDQ